MTQEEYFPLLLKALPPTTAALVDSYTTLLGVQLTKQKRSSCFSYFRISARTTTQRGRKHELALLITHFVCILGIAVTEQNSINII